MLNVIRFLEKMGSEAQWGNATKDEMELALMDAEVEAPLRSAILDKDVVQLQTLLQQKEPVCMIIPGEEEEEEEGEDAPDEKDARRLSSLSLAPQP